MRNKWMFHSVVLLLLGAFASCSSADVPSQTNRDRDAIIAASDDHMRGANELDLKLQQGTYTDDIVNLIPGQPPLVGISASRAYGEARFAKVDRTRTRVSRTIKNIEIAGNLAVEWGTISGEFDAQPVNVKYVWVWRRQADGSWKTAYNITNENAAP